MEDLASASKMRPEIKPRIIMCAPARRLVQGVIGVAVACVCWNAVVAREIKISPLLDDLAMFTGMYISQARACKTDEWKLALRESLIQVQRRESASDLKYFQLVIAWANSFQAGGCDHVRLVTARQAQQTYLDRFSLRGDYGCKLSPNLVC
jgi:hypothetical protein